MGNNKYKILVVEDENNIRSFIQTTLEAGGYHVITAGTFSQGHMLLGSYVPDLMILDLGLPDGDGVELIRLTRKESNVPIVVLSARTMESDKVEALDMGANDYITKPFGTAELMARVRAALRIRILSGDSDLPGGIYQVDDLIIDCERRIVTVGTDEVKLTQTEFNIMALLAQHRGKMLTYTAIIRRIWGSMDDGSIKKLQVNMANIRKKLGIKPGDNRYVVNELGVGYRMLED